MDTGTEQMALDLSTLGLALIALAGSAWVRRRRAVLAVAAVLFFPIGCAAMVASWWPVSPVLAVLVPGATLGVSLLLLALLWADVTFAPFCIEMSYPALLCWFLCPLGIASDYLALLLR